MKERTPDESAGVFPYTRGIYPEMYRKKLWTMRQYAGSGTAKETNRRLKRLLQHGQTGLSVAFDLPTQLGIDPDDARAQGEAGTCGVSVPTLADMEAVLAGIPLQETSLSLTINATAPAVMAMFFSLAQARGAALHQLRGTVQNDPLKEFAARNLYVLPPEPSVQMAVDLIEFCCRHLPRWHPVSVSGYHMREAGADAAQEIGFTLAHAAAYVEHALKRGISVDTFAPRMSFFFSAGIRLIEETAKFRAARRLWANIMRERFQAKSEAACKMKFHAQTAGSVLTSLEIENNAARVTLQALAAVLGGAQSLHTNAKDEALRLPTEATAKQALRIQQIIAWETDLTEYIDPLGGTEAVESLTDRLEQEARGWMAEVERRGGAVQALIDGFTQSSIRASAYRDFQSMRNGSRAVVGVNPFAGPPLITSVARRAKTAASSAETKRIEDKIRIHRASRSAQDAAKALDGLRRSAARRENIMPAMIDAVKAGCTIGEIYGALVKEYGQYVEQVQEV